MGEELSLQADGASPAGKVPGCSKDRSTVKPGLALESSSWVCSDGANRKGKELVPWNSAEPISS